MTTVAYKDGILAGDKQSNWGTTPVPTTKVFKTEDVNGTILYGTSGGKENIEMFCEWFLAGAHPCKKPTIDNNNDGFSAIVIKNGKIYQLCSSLYHQLIEKDFWALGSGADYALGAMAAGKSAREAVEIAISLDINSGIGIDEVW